MAEPESLKRIVKVCMFDQHGTVVDTQTGLRESRLTQGQRLAWHLENDATSHLPTCSPCRYIARR